MDFDSCIRELCETCYPMCQSHPINPTPQSGHKKLKRVSMQEKRNIDMKCENTQSAALVHCNCNYPGNTKLDNVQEKNSFLEYNRLTLNQSKSGGFGDTRNTVRSFLSEEKPEQKYSCRQNKFHGDNFSNLEEKVNFLFELFNENQDKLTGDDLVEQNHIKIPGVSLRDIWQLFNLNKRMSAAEENIEKLTLTVQEMLKKKENAGHVVGDSEDSSIWNSLDSSYENTPNNKMAVLKNRNDLLINLIKTFLKIGSVDEIYSKLALMPKEEESIDSKAKDAPEDEALILNQAEILSTLKSLREQIEGINTSKVKEFAPGESLSSCPERRSKLEVISEQAEYNLKDNFDKDVNTNTEQDSGKFQYGLVEYKGGDGGNGNFDLKRTTSRILTQQESMLRSSFPATFRNLDSTEKINGRNTSDETIVSEGRSKCDSSPQTESPRSGNSSTRIPNTDRRDSVKYSKLSDFKEAFKNSLKVSGSSISSRHIPRLTEKIEHERNRLPRKITTRTSCTSSLKSPIKCSRPSYYSPDLSATRRQDKEATGEILRPVTAPNSAVKSMVAIDLRKLSTKNILKSSHESERTKKELYNNGTNNSKNVKSLNKNLLNKKFLVQTS
ncbi:hypothetical protein RUM44_010699 [Polyplax serrata]|uniref:Uncharacterized protein n=1 Tax=Polyplax serrata TaxID=468196 RepID=A0ABR1AMX9_POLSC